MKIKFIISVALLSLLTNNAFAWSFTEVSVADRTFEVKANKDYGVVVENVTCTQTDGYDSMTVSGYNSIVGNMAGTGTRTIFNSINKHFEGSDIKGVNKIDKNILPAYMKFCAMVNKAN